MEKCKLAVFFKNQLKSTLSPYEQILAPGAKINQIDIWKINVCELLLLLLLWLLCWWLLCSCSTKKDGTMIYIYIYINICGSGLEYETKHASLTRLRVGFPG